MLRPVSKKGNQMKLQHSKSIAAFLAITSFAMINTASADRPSSAGEGKGKEHNAERRDRSEREGTGRHESANAQTRHRDHFDDHRRSVIRDYYHEQYESGRCPKGLARKHNGCMPPGQARKWAVGKPLPAKVVYYPLPRPLLSRVGAPPSGYRYVRVGSDILLIAVGTRMVLDAIQDFGTL